MNRAEEGWERKLGGWRRARREALMAAGGGELDPAEKRLNQARGWAEELRGEAREAGARRIEAGQRGWPAWTSAVALSSSLARREREEGRGGDAGGAQGF